jgi:rubrerythrin
MAAIARTYRVEESPDYPGSRQIVCLLCGHISTHPGDVAELHCPACDYFHEDPVAEDPA